MNNSSSSSDILRNPVLISAYTFMALGVAVIIEWLQERIGLTEILLGFGFVFMLVTTGIVMSTLLNRVRHQEEFEDKISDLKNIILASNMTWLVSEKYVATLERESEVTWVFTPSLENDLNKEGDIFQAVEDNLAKGFEYVYFVPDMPKTLKLIGDYRKLHKYDERQVKFYVIKPSEYMFYTEVVVYDALRGTEQRAIEWVPVNSLNYYIEMDNDHMAQVVGIGMNYIKNYEPTL